MLGLGWLEIVVIGGLVLLLVKPQDYPNFIGGLVRFYRAIASYVLTIRNLFKEVGESLVLEDELEQQRQQREKAARRHDHPSQGSENPDAPRAAASDGAGGPGDTPPSGVLPPSGVVHQFPTKTASLRKRGGAP